MTSPAPDHDWPRLIAAARNGDQQALNELCNALVPAVTRMCQSLVPAALRSKVGESDLVQESLLGASDKIATLQGSQLADLLAWIQVIVEHKASDLKRRYLVAGKRDVTRERSLSEQKSSRLEFPLEDSSATPLGRLISVEQATVIQSLVQRLSPHYQTVVELRHRDGLTFPEIALRLGRTEPSVKNLYVRAVTLLKQGLNEE